MRTAFFSGEILKPRNALLDPGDAFERFRRNRQSEATVGSGFFLVRDRPPSALVLQVPVQPRGGQRSPATHRRRITRLKDQSPSTGL